MIMWFKSLPQKKMDYSEWIPFIRNHWYRKHYMKFVYILQIMILLMPYFFMMKFPPINRFSLILIGILVFIIHECLHIMVIYRKGDISLIFSGIFFWLNTNETLSKSRFWVFMTLPFILLSVVPAVLSLYASDHISTFLLFVCWFNSLISSSDIFNSFLIAIKPKNSVFCRGFYKVTNV